MMKALLSLALITLALALIACQSPDEAPTPTPIPDVIPTPRIADTPTPPVIGTPTPVSEITAEGRVIRQYAGPPEMSIDPEGNYSADIQTNQGTISVELFAEDAPITVNNFVFLARQGFYDGVIFHRVIPNFMIQGETPPALAPAGRVTASRTKSFPPCPLTAPGILAMANAGPNTNGSQFFITVAPTLHLTGNHTIFGRVTAGQEVADAISNARADRYNRPLEEVVIQHVEIKEGN